MREDKEIPKISEVVEMDRGDKVGVVYRWEGEFIGENLGLFIEFYNVCINSGVEKIVIYLDTTGGSNHVYYCLLDIINRGDIEIEIVGLVRLMSYGFSLFYFAECKKKFIGYVVGMTHEVEITLVSGDLKEIEGGYFKTKDNCEIEEGIFLKYMKRVALRDKKKLEEYTSGRDIFFNHKEMIEIMEDCPFGKFIK